MVRLFGLTQVHPSVLQLLRPHSDSLMLESTLTKMAVDVDGEKTSLGFSCHRLTVWNTTAAGFQFRTKASVCPVCWNLRCPFSPAANATLICSFQSVFLLMFVLCYSLTEDFGKWLQHIASCCIASWLWKFFFLLSVV